MVALLQTAQELQSKIKTILDEEWDPIGIHGTAGAEHEYDAYVKHVHAMLREGRNQTELTDYLTWVEQAHMGLSPDRQLTRAVAKKLSVLAKA